MSCIVREYFDESLNKYFKVIKQDCYQYDGKAKEIVPGYEFWTYSRVNQTDNWQLENISDWYDRETQIAI